MPWLLRARTIVQPKNIPMARPSTAPRTAMMTASQRIIERSWARVAPTARRPSSRMRSKIDRPRVFTIPNRAITMARPSSE